MQMSRRQKTTQQHRQTRSKGHCHGRRCGWPLAPHRAASYVLGSMRQQRQGRGSKAKSGAWYSSGHLHGPFQPPRDIVLPWPSLPQAPPGPAKLWAAKLGGEFGGELCGQFLGPQNCAANCAANCVRRNWAANSWRPETRDCHVKRRVRRILGASPAPVRRNGAGRRINLLPAWGCGLLAGSSGGVSGAPLWSPLPRRCPFAGLTPRLFP